MLFLNKLRRHWDALGVPPDAPLLVAFSGGLDSTALLRGLLALQLPNPLRAAHVHHGLHPDAEAWAAHCCALCASWRVECDLLRVRCEAGARRSLEADARTARYRALEAILKPREWLLTGHHRQDQAETFLLQLFRGGGLDGLAAMPSRRPFGQGGLARPLLAMEREALRAFLAAEGVVWIEDPANASARFRRNRIRHELIPAIQAMGWPAVAKTVARGAANVGDAKALVDEVAALDWASCRDARGALMRDRFRLLSPARQRFALRRAVSTQALSMPDRVALERLCHGIVGADSGKTLEWSGGALWLHKNRACLLPPSTALPPREKMPWRPAQGPIAGLAWEAELVRAGPDPADLPRHELDARYFHQQLWIGFRRGGERYVAPNGMTRPLKKALLEQGLAPQERFRVPLLMNDGGEILAVLGHFTCRPGVPAAGSREVMRLHPTAESVFPA